MTVDAVLMVVVAIVTAAFTGLFLWKAHQRDRERDRLAREREEHPAHQVDANQREQNAA